MPFSDFHGNPDVVHHLRDMLARAHFPHAMILAGEVDAKFPQSSPTRQTVVGLKIAGSLTIRRRASES